MTLPSSKRLGLPRHSPASALWFALRYLRAYKQPVFIGKVARLANAKLRAWGKRPEMEASWQRYLRTGHGSGLADALPGHWQVLAGPRGGQAKGHVRLDIGQKAV